MLSGVFPDDHFGMDAGIGIEGFAALEAVSAAGLVGLAHHSSVLMATASRKWSRTDSN